MLSPLHDRPSIKDYKHQDVSARKSLNRKIAKDDTPLGLLDHKGKKVSIKNPGLLLG